jgi:hypothetical protein
MLNQASRRVGEIELLELSVKESDKQSEESRSLLLEAKEELRGIMNSAAPSCSGALTTKTARRQQTFGLRWSWS